MFVIFNRYNKSNESLKVKTDIIEKVGIDNIRQKQRGTRDEIAPHPKTFQTYERIKLNKHDMQHEN